MVLIKFLLKNISQFINGQYDYIYFFYGLSFLFLAIICFNIESKKSQTLPWVLLGLFGLIHGLNEWMHLFLISIGSNYILVILQPIFLGLSYLLLFEFARIGYFRIKNKSLMRPWIYIPLISMVFVGSQSAINGLAISIRYFLGFPASLLAAFTVFSASRIEAKKKTHLLILSILFILYGFLTGLVVDKSDFLLASVLNKETFTQFSGMPIELVRGALVLLATMVIWFYSSIFLTPRYQPESHRVDLKISSWVIMLVIIALMGVGWALTNFLDYNANIQLIKISKESRGSPLTHLLKELSELEKVCISLSQTPAIKEAVISGQQIEKPDPAIEKMFNKGLFDSCYVVDKKGAVITSVGEHLPARVYDKTYISGLYFQDASSGDTGYHLTPVSWDQKRTYFVSYPIKDEEGSILGFVVASKTLDIKLLLQYRLLGIFITFFVCLVVILIFIILRKREAIIEYIEGINLKLQEVDRLKTDFLSSVSHDLKTPLTAIKNAVAILMKDRLKTGFSNSHERELINIILKNTERQANLINNLLDISKIEAGVFPIHIVYHDLKLLVQETLEVIRPQAEEKHISIDFNPGKEALIVPLDVEHTERILLNLLTNAIRYSPENSRIQVVIKERENDVLVSVSDHGTGIPLMEQKKIFSKFYRAPEALMLERGGTGLGLVITKGLVEIQDGKIWLESQPGHGATFYFTLPKWRSRQQAGDQEDKLQG